MSQTCSNCGTVFSDDQQFCPSCGHWVDPLSDAEFEPFDLETEPPEYEEDYGGVATIPYATLVCPSCGAANPESNRHCEECGARLSQGPLPVAPQPLLQTSAGLRAALMIAAVIVGVVLIAMVWRALTGGDEGAAPTETSTSTTSTTVVSTQAIPPISIECSTELSGLPCTNLIDGSTDTYWNDASLKGEGAWIEVTFGEAWQLEQIVFNNVTNEEKFTLNYRVKNIEIVTDDVTTPVPKRLEDQPGAQIIRLQTLGTRTVRINITGVYPSEPFTDAEGNNLVPFNDLAVAELEFFGKPAG